MPVFQFAANGQPFDVEAPTFNQAVSKARLRMARERMTAQATAGAAARNPQPTAAETMRERAALSPTEQLARARLGVAERMPPESVAGGLAGVGAAAAPVAALSYAAAEGAEKVLGLPPWAGEAIGLVSPGRALVKGLASRVLGRAATEATTKAGAKALEGAAEKRLAQEAEKIALKREAIEIAKRRLALAEAKAAGTTARGAEAQVASTVAGQPVAVPVAAAAIPAAAPAVATPVARVASTAAQVATRHNQMMEFAKQAAKRSPKLGEKIWMELDKAGNPVRILTPDQAGAAARAGKATTWVKNLWS